jgi:hypothetical protein
MADSITLTGGISNEFEGSNPHQCIWRMEVTYYDEKGEAQVVTFGYPLTIEFNIVRNTFAQSNTASFTIYNLAPATRSNLFLERWLVTKKYVKFWAGYENQLILLFSGMMQEAYSHRSGVDVQTTIQALDVGYNQPDIGVHTFTAGTTFQEAYAYLVNLMEDCEIGSCGRLEGQFKTDTTFKGTPLQIIQQITNNQTFIDNAKINTLNENECLNIGVTVLNAQNGLIGTPYRQGQEVVADSILNPSLYVGQLLEIQSDIASEFSGTYFLCGLTHRGTISGRVSGQRITTVNLITGQGLSNSPYMTTGETINGGFQMVTGNQIEPVNGSYGASVEEVYRYIKDNNGDISGYTKKITERLSWKEMVKCGESLNTNADINAEISKDILYNCQTIAIKLTNFVNTYYKNVKIKVTSGWRTKETNALYSNAKAESKHLAGGAIDFQLLGVDTQTAYNNVFNPYWDKYCYLFYPTKGGNAVIHVQSTLGARGAKR